MKEKKVLSKFLIYNYTELDALKEYLEDMALQGWILTDMNTWLTFKKAEPQKIIYSVELDENASIYDMFFKVKEIENLEECLIKGWVLVAGFGKLRVYKTKNENAIPIIKDEKVKLKKIVRSTIAQRAILWFYLPFIFMFNVIMMNLIQSSSIQWSRFVGNGFYILFCALLIFQISSFLVWKNKAKKRVDHGGNIAIYSLKHLIIKNKILKIALAVFLLLLCLIAVISIIIGYEFVAICLIFLIAIILIILLVTACIQRMRLSSTSTLLMCIGFGFAMGFIIIIIIAVADYFSYR